MAPNPYPEATVFHSEARSLVSSVVGQEFRIPVWLPPSYAQSERTYPVLYVTDSNLMFGMATDAVALLLFGQEIPEIIVVGIAYPMQSYDDWARIRRRDLTPTAMPDRPGSGGADRFLTFLRTELFPFIETNYWVDPADRALFGYSLGGLFTLYTLFSQPSLFRRYIAGSPSVKWDASTLLQVEAAYAVEHRTLPATLFMSSGSLEVNPKAIDTLSAVQNFDAILRGRHYDGFHHEYLVFDGETHLSGVAPALVRGAKSIYASAPAS